MKYVHKIEIVRCDNTEDVVSNVEGKLNEIQRPNGHCDPNVEIKSIQYIHTCSHSALWTAFIHYVITTA